MTTTLTPFYESQTVTAPARKSAGTWLNVVAHLDPRYGGISAVLPSFCEAVSRGGRAEASLAPFCAPDEQFEVTPGLEVERYPLGNTKWRGGDEVRRRFQAQIDRSAGLHIHGLWQEHCALAARAARKAAKPYIISAHGMLEPWALHHKRWKKLLYSMALERRNLNGAACLHALTDREARDYRRFGLDNPVAIVPNGVELPASTDPSAFFHEYPQLAGKRIVLFLARLHFKKGLDLLCQAWKNADRPGDVQLVLAGPDFEGTEARVKSLIKDLDITSSVTFTGMLKGERKWNALAAAEVFVLPSRSEGLSVSVLEALGMGVPAIVSSQCNVPEVQTRECGWMIEPDTNELTAALNQYFESSAGNRFMMGMNGRRVIEEKYSWHIVGRQMSAVYEWLAGGGSAPEADVRFASGAKA
jgi:glycosyltransferase involved in cell wall biosynthesis